MPYFLCRRRRLVRERFFAMALVLVWLSDCDIVRALVSRNGRHRSAQSFQDCRRVCYAYPGLPTKVGNPGLRYRTLPAFEHPPPAESAIGAPNAARQAATGD